MAAKVIRKIPFPERSCKDNCAFYPCFEGIEKCLSNFAQYGCKLYKSANSSSQTSGKST